MQAATIRSIRSGKEFDHLFPQPKRTDPITMSDATVQDTVKTVASVVRKTLPDTAKIAPLLRQNSLEATCRAIWNFVYRHVRYKIDTPGTEQVRHPRRTWADRASGVDCDCYTTFISSILTNLGIPHTYRITEYKHKGYFQHIYPVVPKSAAFYGDRQNRAHYIVLDCVKDAFNDEEPFSSFQDTDFMRMQELNGIDGTTTGGIEDFTVDGLGRLRRRRGRKAVEVEPVNPATVATSSAQPAQVAPPSAVVAPSQVPGFTPPTISYNQGTLKDGRKVVLSQETSPRGSTLAWMGRQINDRKVYVDGRFLGALLTRFIVRNGILRGVNGKGDVYVDRSDGKGIVHVPGVSIKNPTWPLGGLSDGIGALIEADTEGNLAINGLGGAPGLYIPADCLDKALAVRGGTLQASGLNALGELLGNEALHSILDNVEAMGFGDFEMDGLDGIDGLSLAELDLEGIMSGIGQIGAAEADVVQVVDGLGRVRKVRTTRASRRAAAAAPAQSAAPTPAPVASRRLGLYVPLNTLRNLIRVRDMQVQRLRAAGHNIDPTSLNLSGIEGLGATFFGKVIRGAVKVASNVTTPISQFVPALAPMAAVTNFASSAYEAKDASRQPQTTSSPVMQTSADQQALARRQAMEAEASGAYADIVRYQAYGLDGTATSALKTYGGYVLGAAGVVGLLWAVHHYSTGGKKTSPKGAQGLGGIGKKGKGKKKGKAKAESKAPAPKAPAKAAKKAASPKKGNYQMVGMS